MKRKNNSGKNNKKNECTQQRRLLIAVCAFIAITITCSVFLGSIITQAAPSKETYKYYTSIQIQSGDTLWDIAGRYMTNEYKNRKEYIKEVCFINHVSENEIHAGQFLVIPYYSPQARE